MDLTRRNVLKIAGGSALIISFLPRFVFAKPNSIKNIRTGLQPNGKTRLVIETTNRPLYKLDYEINKFNINLSNTSANNIIQANISKDTLIKEIKQLQLGDKLKVIISLKKDIKQIPQSQIMVLEATPDNGYRLVIDFDKNNNVIEKNKENNELNKTKQNIIVIDAGHGGKDPGCIGKYGTKEKTVVLSVAKKLKNELDKLGFKTYLTRDKDIFLNLGTRASIAEKKHADLFLSIHANANLNRQMKGFSIYTLSKKASDEEAQKLADTENAADKIDVDGFTEFAPDIRIALSALQQHAIAEMSVDYAKKCAKSLRNQNITQQKGKDIYSAPFAVLRSTIPGALIELGYLSNSKEEKLLTNNNHQNKLVKAILNSIKDYDFENY